MHTKKRLEVPVLPKVKTATPSPLETREKMKEKTMPSPEHAARVDDKRQK